MPDPVDTKPAPKSGNSQIISAIISAALASYLMTQASLHGVDFKTLGVDSELVKSTLIGVFVGVIAKLTPQNLVALVKDIIIFKKNAFKEWSDARKEGE